MKKLLAKIVCVMIVLAMAIATLAGCSEGSWSGIVTLKNSGEVLSNGGFIAETENYIYFINGIGESTADNKMGEPLKGALLVADKNDLSKTEVVVPKLFVATDYNMGVFVDGGYAYYGTPNIEKNSAGNIANNQMTFMRTKLDGSGKSDVYFTIDSLGAEYRIVKAGNTVYIYYFEDNALYCYNTAKKENTTVIKKDATDNGHKTDDGYYTLENLTFVNKVSNDGVVAYFTTTVYSDKYNENLAKNPGYERKTATYNNIYAVRAGNNTPELVKKGKQIPEKFNEKYQILLIHDGYIFYSQTINSITKNYANKLNEKAEIPTEDKATLIFNQDYVKATNVFVSLEEVYVIGENSVYKTTATVDDANTKTPILPKDSVNRLLFVNKEGSETYLYYYNTLNNLVKVGLNDLEKEIRVSDQGVATTWYMPEIITIGEKQYIFYCDNSLYAKSYIEYVDLSAEVKDEDIDDDGETEFFLKEEEIKELGKKTGADKAAIVSEKINALAIPEDGLTGADFEQGAEFNDEYEKVLSEYNALGSLKDQVAEKQKLANIKKAFEVIQKYEKLSGIKDCVNTEEAEAKVEDDGVSLKSKYESVKEYLTNFKNSDERDAIDDLISGDLKAHYTKACELFK